MQKSIKSMIMPEPVFPRGNIPLANKQMSYGEKILIIFFSVICIGVIYLIIVEEKDIEGTIFGIISTIVLVVIGLTWGLTAVKIEKISESKREAESEHFYYKARMYGAIAASGILILIALFLTLDGMV